MNRHLLRVVVAAALVVAAPYGKRNAQAAGQKDAPVSAYDPQAAFAPLTLPDPVNAYRSGDGTPGPAYWQNRADYTIHAQLNPSTQMLTGDETISYTNNSPAALACLWIQLDQNIYKPDARARYANAGLGKAFTGGFVLDSVETGRKGDFAKAEYVVSDTRMQIRLREAVVARGGKIAIRIRYHFTVPGTFGGRTAHAASRNGEIYDIAQWYPRMAVYDDLRGWNTLPYLGSEFYLEYGDFDYYVTVPWDMLVAGSGELQNPQDVLTAKERARLEQARGSDKTVFIRDAAEIGDPKSRPVQSGTLTWHFHMNRTRDVSFAASRAFIWDAARINLSDGKTALAMSFYPVESAGAKAWARSTEYVKDAAENFSRRWAPYPYPAAVAVAGPVGAMEYPGIVFDDMKDSGAKLFLYTAHEIGHTWFPMMVGFNERRDQWMDEGFNTFIDVYESNDFNHGEYAPKRDPEYAPGGGNPVEEIVPLLEDPNTPILMARSDQIGRAYSHPLSYFKSALGLVLLREQILGPQRFDWAFRKFIRDWSWRHPSPSDFFRAMDSASGEDLSWFWRGWYMHNWTLDFAAEGAHPVDGDWGKGAVVTIDSLDRLVMPVTVKIDFADGKTRRIRLPVETWIQKSRADITLDSAVPVVSITVDPDAVIPDKNRRNNVWTAAK